MVHVIGGISKCSINILEPYVIVFNLFGNSNFLPSVKSYQSLKYLKRCIQMQHEVVGEWSTLFCLLTVSCLDTFKLKSQVVAASFSFFLLSFFFFFSLYHLDFIHKVPWEQTSIIAHMFSGCMIIEHIKMVTHRKHNGFLS